MHEPEELNEVFKGLLNSCDILVVEHAVREWRKEFKAYLNEISFRGRSAKLFKAYLFPRFGEKLVGMIANSQKRIEVEKSPASKADVRRFKAVLGEAVGHFLAGNLEEACELYLRGNKMLVEWTRKRDVCMANQLIDLQRRNRKSHILVIRGMEHKLYPLLKGKVDVKQEFPYKPYRFTHVHELVRRLSWGLAYDRSLVARAIVDSLIHPYLESSYPARERARVARSILEKLSYGDLRELCKFISVRWREEHPTISSVLWLKRRGFMRGL